MSKALDGSFVCTLLLDISTSDLSPPLSFFQATRVTREDITKLVGTLHRASASRTGVTPSLSADQLREVVGVWWPRLEQALIAIPDSTEVSGPVREDREILEEILEAVRAVRKTSAESAGVRIARARLAELETVKRQESALAEAAERDLGNCLTRLSALQHELAEAENVGTPDMAHLREVIRREDEQRIMWESRLRQARNRQAEFDVRVRELQKLAEDKSEAG